MDAGANWFEALGAAVAEGSLSFEVLFYGAVFAVANGGTFASGARRTALSATDAKPYLIAVEQARNAFWEAMALRASQVQRP